MNRNFNQVPHLETLDELGLILISISRELPSATSFLRWVKTCAAMGKTKPQRPHIGWMMVMKPHWAMDEDQKIEKKLQVIIHLYDTVRELEGPLRYLTNHFLDFMHHKSIQTAIKNLADHYQALPCISPDISLIKNGKNLLDNPEIANSLSFFIDRVDKVKESLSELKKITFSAVFNQADPLRKDSLPFDLSTEA